MWVATLVGLALALCGCAVPRTVAFVYYPNAPPSDTFPQQRQFAAEAQEECAKYGLAAVHTWDSWTDWDRVRSTYSCVMP
jgi:hypothetical protein